ncbi:MAG: NUDIX domain-containing protein [Planctomycetes bacterium]|nr:NUDIX domain-containing protein [Planctomycetota bacterium]
MTHHRKLNCWLQLGGHADGDPDVLNVARREAVEESGIDDIAILNQNIFDLDIHDIPAHGNVASHKHYDVRFLLQSRSQEQVTISDESNDLAWFTVADLDAVDLDASIRRMQRKWLQSPQPTAPCKNER